MRSLLRSRHYLCAYRQRHPRRGLYLPPNCQRNWGRWRFGLLCLLSRYSNRPQRYAASKFRGNGQFRLRQISYVLYRSAVRNPKSYLHPGALCAFIGQHRPQRSHNVSSLYHDRCCACSCKRGIRVAFDKPRLSKTRARREASIRNR